MVNGCGLIPADDQSPATLSGASKDNLKPGCAPLLGNKGPAKLLHMCGMMAERAEIGIAFVAVRNTLDFDDSKDMVGHCLSLWSNLRSGLVALCRGSLRPL